MCAVSENMYIIKQNELGSFIQMPFSWPLKLVFKLLGYEYMLLKIQYKLYFIRSEYFSVLLYLHPTCVYWITITVPRKFNFVRNVVRMNMPFYYLTLSEKKVLSRTLKDSSAQRSAGTFNGSRWNPLEMILGGTLPEEA